MTAKVSFFLIFVTLASCMEMKKTDEYNSLQKNAMLVDSISAQTLQTDYHMDSLVKTSQSYRHTHDIFGSHTSIRELNEAISEAKDLIMQQSKSATDKRAVHDILVTQQQASLLLKKSEGSKKYLTDIFETIDAAKANIHLLQPNSGGLSEVEWAQKHFKDRPLHEVIVELNQWVLANERLLYQLVSTAKYN